MLYSVRQQRLFYSVIATFFDICRHLFVVVVEFVGFQDHVSSSMAWRQRAGAADCGEAWRQPSCCRQILLVDKCREDLI